MSEEGIIEVRNLRKFFGSVEAVRGLSFSVRRGSVVGFIGANGAGKTTTMRILTTLDLPDEGDIRICGYNVIASPYEIRRRVGWMPDAVGTYDNMTVWEYMDFFARAFELRGAIRRKRLEEVMAFTDLQSLAERPCNKLSKGMTQRLILGRTLLHDPELLILDEPAAGLDPKARLEFKNVISILAEQGKTIFISSHILSELGEMCDELLFIDKGQLVHEGSTESLKFRKGKDTKILTIRIAGEPQRLFGWVEQRQELSLLERLNDGVRLEVVAQDEQILADLLADLIKDKLPVFEFHREEVRLEDAFVDLIRETNRQESK